MGAEHEGVEVREEFVATLDGGADEGRYGGIHEGLDDVADVVVAGAGFVAVDGEAGTMDAELHPADEELGCGLGAFEAANVVAVTLGWGLVCVCGCVESLGSERIMD